MSLFQPFFPDLYKFEMKSDGIEGAMENEENSPDFSDEMCDYFVTLMRMPYDDIVREVENIDFLPLWKQMLCNMALRVSGPTAKLEEIMFVQKYFNIFRLEG